VTWGGAAPAAWATELVGWSALMPDRIWVRALQRPTFLAYHSWSQRLETLVPGA